MAQEIAAAFEKVIDKQLLYTAFAPIASFLEENCSRIDLTYKSNFINDVDHATLLDFELIKIDNVTQENDTLVFRIVISADVEIEETIHGDRQVDCVQKWLTLSCSANTDDILGSFSIESIDAY